MTQPDTYKGRYVVLRAKVSEIRATDTATTVKLAEYDLGSTGFDREVGFRGLRRNARRGGAGVVRRGRRCAPMGC